MVPKGPSSLSAYIVRACDGQRVTWLSPDGFLTVLVIPISVAASSYE
jgi:hypothetical protein